MANAQARSGQLLIEYEDAPLRRFHILVATSGTGGQFSDGFVLGIIGISISLAAPELHLNALWLGLLGAASLAGLFVGSLLTGPFADRHGRRGIFGWDMIVFTVISLLQFFVTSPVQLLILRLLLGITLGADYVVSKSLVTEYAPRRLRGRLLSVLAVAWAGGYVCAYFVGFVLRELGPESWRWMLASSAVPSFLIFFLRLGVPESPLWLVNHGQTDKAARIVREKLGTDIAPPSPSGAGAIHKGFEWGRLFSPAWRLRTVVGCLFYTCQVIPFFALSTFTPRVMASLGVQGSYTGSLVYNAFLLCGAVLGMLVVDRISRRRFLIGSFFLSAALLMVLTAWVNIPPLGAVLFFALFACILAAAVNLEFVYPPELFSTDLRASGIGVVVAASRIGSAVSTFLLPIVVQGFGVRAALGACVVVLALGGVSCQLWAPETGKIRLGAIGDQEERLPLPRKV